MLALILIPFFILSSTGCIADPERELSAGTLRWSFLVGSEIHSAPAISLEGIIYFTARDGNMYALSPYGELLWVQGTEVPIYSSPAIGVNGLVYAGSEDGSMVSVDDGGAIDIIHESGGQNSSAPAISSSGRLFYGRESGDIEMPDGVIIALEPGYMLNWSAGAPDYVPHFSPVSSYDGEYILPYRFGLYSFNPTNGDRNWTYTIAAEMTSRAPAVNETGTIYFGATDGVYAVTTEGELFWYYEIDALEIFSPVIGADGTIYVGTRNSNEALHLAFFALNPDGTLKWSLNSFNGAAPPVIGSDGTVYWPTMENLILAISEEGKLEWAFVLPGRAAWSSEAPTLSPDGTLFMGTSTGVLLAIRTDSRGLADSAWPRFRGDNHADGRVH
ncbi:PQQ-binding-like beta-propeller repeat protein [Gemmatimonadota bacterium]